jgi:hypothetical protein
VKISIWKLVGSLFLLGLLGICLWYYNQIEYDEKEVVVGFQGAAVRNPLLAAGRLAERYGAVAHHVPVYSKPPQSAGTLIFAAPRHQFSKGQNDALLDWVTATGSHLIIAKQSLQDRDKNKQPDRKKSENTFRDSLLDLLDASAMVLPTKNDYGLNYVLGNGRVTVLAGLDFIKNDMIGKDDNAALFVYLTSLTQGQNIWFVYGSDMPTLWRWLVDHAWAALIAAALLLIVWLWMISRRFGPLLPVRSVARRSIVEHVAASARYLWRGKQEQALYQTLCDDFYKRTYLCYPQWSRLSVQELSQQIVLWAHETRIPQLSALTGHDVERLLDTSHPRDKKQFAAHSHLLDILRNKL